MKIPRDRDEAVLTAGGHTVKLTNLRKVFWPEDGFTKGDLLQYYADLAPVILPHLQNRAMVMKRYPHGISGEFFFMKRTPSPRPEWLRTCSIEHASGNIIDFPVIQDLAAVLWVVNLGCIDLNPWYARCDDIDRPDYLHFDLDPVEGASFAKVCDAALAIHETLDAMKIPNYAKTTGSSGIHVYVPIIREPLQKEVWTFAKSLAKELASKQPKLITAEYRIAKRPRAACWWITTRMHGAAPWLQFIRSGPNRALLSPRRSPGMRLRREFEWKISVWTMSASAFPR